MSLYESIKSNQNRIAPKRRNLKESNEMKPIKLSDKYVEISVPKGSISATPSIAREVNSKKPNKKIIKRITNDGKEIKEAGEKRNRIPRNWKRIDYTLNRAASSGKPGDKFTVTRDEYGRAIETDSKGNKYQTNWSMMRSPEMVTINKIDESAEGIEEFWNKIKNKEIKVGDSIPMDNGIGSTAELIDFDGNSDYILIKHNYPNGKGFEYVSAWAPEISNGKLSWGQGHYFNEDLDAAKKHFRSHTLRQTVYESCNRKGKKKLKEAAGDGFWYNNRAGEVDAMYKLLIGSENLEYIKEKLDVIYDIAREELSNPDNLHYIKMESCKGKACKGKKKLKESYEVDTLRAYIEDIVYNKFQGTDFFVNDVNFDLESGDLTFNVTAYGGGDENGAEELNRDVTIKLNNGIFNEVEDACDKWMKEHNSPDNFYEACGKKAKRGVPRSYKK